MKSSMPFKPLNLSKMPQGKTYQYVCPAHNATGAISCHTYPMSILRICAVEKTEPTSFGTSLCTGGIHPKHVRSCLGQTLSRPNSQYAD